MRRETEAVRLAVEAVKQGKLSVKQASMYYNVSTSSIYKALMRENVLLQ